MGHGATSRRTQAQRTEETRHRLIDATIRAIRDDGYRATTTRRIADYAGRGPLVAWVRVAAVRTAVSALRAT